MNKLTKSVPLILMLVASSDAAAYIGPGLGVGAISVIIGIIISLFLALFAIVWYPIKRLFKGKGSTPDKTEDKAKNNKA